MRQAVENYIYRMRGESEQKRRKHALAWAVGITGFVTIIWLINLQYTLSVASGNVPTPAADEQGFVSEFAERIARGWDRVVSGIIELTN